MKKRFIYIILTILLSTSLCFAASVTKGLIGKQDTSPWDGVASTFTRSTSAGYDITLNKIDWPGVDVLAVYGGGVNRTDDTISDALTAIGTSNKVMVWLSPGTWTFNENVDWSSYTNVFFHIPPGVTISHGAYTINMPNIDAGWYQIFSGTGTATVSKYVESIWFSTLTQAVATGAKEVHVTPNNTQTITATCSVSTGQTIYGDGDTSLVNVGGNIDAFTIDGKTNVTLKNFKIDGKKATYTTSSNNAICSPANGTGSSNIKIEGMTIVDVAGNSIEILSQTGSHSENIMILNNIIMDSGAHGIVCQDYVDDVMVRGNRVINYGLGVADRVGIVIGRDSINQQIIGNYVEDGGSSLGTQPHGISLDTATNGVVSNNIVKGAQAYGIEIGGSSEVSVTGNQVYSTTKAGIVVIGGGADVCKHISITGNTTFETGYAGIFVYVNNYVADEHEDITVVGNTIHNAQADPGIYFGYVNNGVISGNTVIDSYKAGVYLVNCNYINVNGNMLKNSNTSDTGAHNFGVATSGCTFCLINGYLELIIASTSSSGTGEDTLHTITIPQNYHRDWKGLRFKGVGIKTGSGGNKTVKIHWGATSYTFNAAANDTNDWRIEGELLFTADAAQRLSWLGWNGATPLQGWESGLQDLSAAGVDLKITGECADASDVVMITGWMLEVF